MSVKSRDKVTVKKRNRRKRDRRKQKGNNTNLLIVVATAMGILGLYLMPRLPDLLGMVTPIATSTWEWVGIIMVIISVVTLAVLAPDKIRSRR